MYFFYNRQPLCFQPGCLSIFYYFQSQTFLKSSLEFLKFQKTIVVQIRLSEMREGECSDSVKYMHLGTKL